MLTFWSDELNAFGPAQEYEMAELVVFKVKVFPAHIGALVVAFIVGGTLFSVITTLAVEVQPLAPVTVTI